MDGDIVKQAEIRLELRARVNTIRDGLSSAQKLLVMAKRESNDKNTLLAEEIIIRADNLMDMMEDWLEG